MGGGTESGVSALCHKSSTGAPSATTTVRSRLPWPCPTLTARRIRFGERALRGQIHAQRQVLIEYPPQRGVHGMRGCEIAAESAVHHDYSAAQFGGVDLVDEWVNNGGGVAR